MWNVLIWLVTGALIGWIAGRIMKGKGGLVRNIVVGIVGSLLGGWLAEVIGIGGAGTFSLGGILIAIGGACLFIWLGRLVVGK